MELHVTSDALLEKKLELQIARHHLYRFTAVTALVQFILLFGGWTLLEWIQPAQRSTFRVFGCLAAVTAVTLAGLGGSRVLHQQISSLFDQALALTAHAVKGGESEESHRTFVASAAKWMEDSDLQLQATRYALGALLAMLALAFFDGEAAALVMLSVLFVKHLVFMFEYRYGGATENGVQAAEVK